MQFPEVFFRYFRGEVTADEGHDEFEALVESGEVAEIDRWKFQTMFWGRDPSAEGHVLCVWRQLREEILSEYIEEYPGCRPRGWWDWDAPRCTDDQLRIWGFRESHYFFSEKRAYERPCEPRRRLGGTGTPRYEVLTVDPLFCCGIVGPWLSRHEIETLVTNGPPDRWTRFRDERFRGDFPDPDDPPAFEAQAEYLGRHGLFFPGEEARLSPADFEPELLRG